MLKRFADFTNERKAESTKKVVPAVDVPKPHIKEESKPKVEEPKAKLESFDFVGKIVKFPGKIKPSISIIMLENNKVSKDKLHYIISSQTENSLVVLKYNEKAEIKLTEFVNTLIGFYKKNESLKIPLNEMVVEGTEQFSIIKNIPKINIGDKKLIDLLNDDLIKLLK